MERKVQTFAANLDLEVGICGEHGGEPQPVGLCYRVGDDDISLLAILALSKAMPSAKITTEGQNTIP